MPTIVSIVTAVILTLLNAFAAAGIPWYIIAIVLTAPLWWFVIEFASIISALLLVSLVVALFDAV